MINFDNSPPSVELTEIEKQLGFRIKSGMIWSKSLEIWTVPRIDHMQKAMQLLEEYKRKLEELKQ